MYMYVCTRVYASMSRVYASMYAYTRNIDKIDPFSGDKEGV